MTAKVIPFAPRVVEAQVRTNAVLAGARLAKLSPCIVIGVMPDGSLYTARTGGEQEAVFFLEAAKTQFFFED